MAEFGDRVQALMNKFYDDWQKEENRGKSRQDMLEDYPEIHQIAVVFGNFNYQVENGGLEQWIYNGYFHDDAEKFSRYLEIGAESDDRCKIILDEVDLLMQYALETDCDRDGDYRDEDGDNFSIGYLIDCDKFDKWYYEHCGKDDWWETVGGIIDKVGGLEVAPARQDSPIQMESPGTGQAGEDVGDRLSLRAYVENAEHAGYGGFIIPLPTTKETLAPWLAALELNGDNRQNIAVREYQGSTEVLRALDDRDYPLDELNYLATKICSLDGERRELFLAALETGDYNGDIGKIINLTENLDRFNLQPAFSPGQYGEFLLDRAAVEHSDLFSHLEASGEREERALAQYIQLLEKCVDKSVFGHIVVEAEHGKFTEYGYLTENGELREVYRGSQDIPAEYHLLMDADAPEIAVGADLTTFVMKAHALGGDFMADVKHNMNTLEARSSAEYLMVVTDRTIFLTEAAHAYREGSDAHNTVMAAVEKDGTKAFALHVTDIHGERITGDVVALNVGTLDTSALEMDILTNSIRLTHVDAVTKDGQNQTFTPAQWVALEPVERDQLQSWTRRFDSADQQTVLHHLEDIRETHTEHGRIVDPDELLAGLNASYMTDAKCPRPDMLRVTLSAAKEMLTHGDTPVYRLFPEGPKELSPLDAMQSRGGLWYQQNREFAIHKRDMGGLEKWAKRGAKAMTIRRQPERNTPEKTKSREPEL